MSIDPNTNVAERPALDVIVVKAVAQLRAAQDAQLYRLKRGTELMDAMLEPVFVSVKAQLRKAGLFVQDDLLACALLLVARLSETKNSRKLGDALNKAEFSSLRFANLVRCEEPADLFINLQRAVRFCENSVDPFDLVRLVLGWTDAQRDSTRKKLIAQFYAIA